mmetsp:Transcript_24367/g.57585  ORF Transcript_24367/g.57585 Transcript_24367/m.57585 type:complete len:257 (+) Transcript_24367:34-804(+)
MRLRPGPPDPPVPVLATGALPRPAQADRLWPVAGGGVRPQRGCWRGARRNFSPRAWVPALSAWRPGWMRWRAISPRLCATWAYSTTSSAPWRRALQCWRSAALGAGARSWARPAAACVGRRSGRWCRASVARPRRCRVVPAPLGLPGSGCGPWRSGAASAGGCRRTSMAQARNQTRTVGKCRMASTRGCRGASRSSGSGRPTWRTPCASSPLRPASAPAPAAAARPTSPSRSPCASAATSGTSGSTSWRCGRRAGW